jgi:hypothetical protein
MLQIGRGTYRRRERLRVRRCLMRFQFFGNPLLVRGELL